MLGVLDIHVVPLDVNTFPLALGETELTALVPFPNITALAVKVVAPVPPFATVIPVAFHVPVVILPSVVIEVDPIVGAAPMVLYEIVFTADPLKEVPETSPVPILLKLNALTVLVEKLIFALPSNEVPLMVTGVDNLEAVAAFPLIDPIIVLLNVFVPTTVCTPLSVISPFALNVSQSAADSKPLFVLEAVGIFNVMVGVLVLFETELLISVPLLLIANAFTAVTVPFVSVGFPVKSAYAPLKRLGLLLKSI